MYIFTPSVLTIWKRRLPGGAEFDPRKYLSPAPKELKKMIVYKNTTFVGSAGKA